MVIRKTLDWYVVVLSTIELQATCTIGKDLWMIHGRPGNPSGPLTDDIRLFKNSVLLACRFYTVQDAAKFVEESIL